MINRAAVLVRLKQPFIDWINSADPEDTREPVSLEEANEERTIYLIAEDEAEVVDKWLELNYVQIFECELEDWVMDSSLWPEDLSKEKFDEWCSIECHSVIMDTVGDVIEDDEWEEE